MITSSRHDKERKDLRKKRLGIFLGAVLLILIFRSPVEGFLSGIFQYIARPMWVVKNTTGDFFSQYVYIFQSKNLLYEENARLKNSLDLVALEAYSREQLRKENEELKLMFARQTGRTLLLARVLANPGRAPYDTFVIDAGESDGLREGMKVFVDGDFVIGEISRIFNKSAVVTLYSSDGSELPVTIEKMGTSSIPTIGYGIGGGSFRSILPKGAEVAVGDTVIIPSIAPQYLGTIDAVVRADGSSLQEVYFKLPINIYALKYVYIATAEEVQAESAR